MIEKIVRVDIFPLFFLECSLKHRLKKSHLRKKLKRTFDIKKIYLTKMNTFVQWKVENRGQKLILLHTKRKMYRKI